MKKAVVAYVPVMHRGYLTFFKTHAECDVLYLVSEDLTQENEPFIKDIRALPASEMQKILKALDLFKEVNIVDEKSLQELAKQEISLVMPDEEFMHSLAEKYFTNQDVQFDSTFLRWDRKNILASREVESAHTILPADFNQTFLNQATHLKTKSADWWRQVGGVIVKNGEVVLSAWNKHVPSEIEPYFNGDPRATFHKGEFIELSTAIHAESALVAEAAKKGISLNGSDLYVTTFPCPVCAKLIVSAGIKKIFFSEGYAMLDGETLLKAAGVEIFKVTP